MIRTQIYLTEAQHQALHQAAKREGVSMTALLRRMVDRELFGRLKSRDYAKDAVMALADLGRSGRTDISENHDEALAEAFRDDAVR
jgi:hypothetical protein